MNSPQIQAAYKAVQDVQNEAAAAGASIAGAPGLGLSEAQGQEGITNSYYQQKINNALQAYQNAIAEQQTQQSGLGAAGGLVQPTQAGPTNVPYYPGTGQYGTPAAGAYGTTGSSGLQNVGSIAGQINIGQNVTQLNSYLGGAQVIGSNLNSLISSANINPVGLTYANGLIQFGSKAMSDPNYQKFAGQINDFVASLAPILGVGGNVTDMKTQMSNQIVNGLQSGSTIQQVVSYFLSQAQQKIQGLQAGGGVNTGGTQTGTTFGSFFGS